jgi:tetratricopeptide (TPR) repeat protein
MSSVFRQVLVTEDFHSYLKTSGHGLLPLVERLVQRIEYFVLDNQVIRGPGIRRLDSNLYKARLSYDLRIPFTVSTEGEEMDLCLGDVGSHAEGDSWHRNPPKFDARVVLEAFDRPEPLEVETHERDRHSLVLRVRRFDDTWVVRRSRNPDASLRLALSPQQETIAQQQGPILLRGGAGSGKTTVALYRMLLDERPKGDRLYVTFTPQLKRHAEQLHAELAHPDVPAPRFLTIEELCREILGEVADTRFPREQRMTPARFRALYGRNNAVVGRNPETILEDILGAIKGDERLLFTPDRDWLMRAEYLDSKRRLAEDADQVYREFERYRQLEASWDDVDLARAAWWAVCRHPAAVQRYREVVVDEVQDLTAFHLALLMKLAESPRGLFLAGDTQQSIHPSRFEWLHTRTLFHSVLGVALGGDSLQTLTTNHRSPGSVVRLMNAITAWRQATWSDDTSFEVTSHRDTRPLWRLTPDQITVLPEPEQLSTRLMVIVADEAAQVEARQRFGEALVYTVPEAKGLESEYVLLWGVLGHDRVVWEREDPREDRFRMRLNRLTVALTRCLDELFVVDDFVPANWEPWSSGAWQGGDAALHALAQVLKVAPEAIEAIALRAENNEARGNLVQAAALYLRIDRPLDAARCHTQLENWPEVARCCELAGRFDLAATASEKAERWAEAARYHLAAAAPLEAARCHVRGGQHSQALKLYLAHGAWAEAARCHEHLGDLVEAAKTYRRAGLLADQGRVLVRTGAHREALEVFRQLGDARGIGTCLEALDEHEPAIAAFREAQDWPAVARLALRLGWSLEAGEAHRRAGNPRAAAGVYADLEEWPMAAGVFVEAGLPMQAAWCLEKLRETWEAAGLYEQATLRELRDRPGTGAGGGKRVHPDDLPPAVGSLADWPADAWTQGLLHAARVHFAAGERSAGNRCLAQHEAMQDRDWDRMAKELRKAYRWDEAARFHAMNGNTEEEAWCLEEGESFLRAAQVWQTLGRAEDQQRCEELHGLSSGRAHEQIARVYARYRQFDRAIAWALIGRRNQLTLDLLLDATLRYIVNHRSYDSVLNVDDAERNKFLAGMQDRQPRKVRDSLLARIDRGFLVASWYADGVGLDRRASAFRDLDALARERLWPSLAMRLQQTHAAQADPELVQQIARLLS